MRCLVAGPYVGELGWALGCWIPQLRKVADEYDDVAVIVPHDTAPLYEDFTSEIVDVRVAPGTSKFFDGRALSCSTTSLEHDLKERGLAPERYGTDRSVVRRELERFRRPYDGSDVEKLWYRYGPDEPAKLDRNICLAFRPIKTINGVTYGYKAWPIERCRELSRLLFEAGYVLTFVGGRDNWGFAEYGVDLRGAPLDCQLQALAEARACVGPSSAPLHLAQLCGTGVVTWLDNPNAFVRSRYERWWNPFEAPVSWLGETQPGVDVVFRATREAVD